MSLPAQALEALLANDGGAASTAVGVSLAPDLGTRSGTLLTARLADLRAHPEAEAWLLRVIALRTGPRAMIGLAGFHGPPDITGTVEVGYEIDSASRRHGYASEATAALVTWALGQSGVRRVVAAIRPDNVASLRVVGRLGFAPIGSRWDAIEGRTLLFERRTPCPPGPTPADGAKMHDGERDRRVP